MITIEPDFLYLTCTDSQAQKLDAVWVKSRKAYRLPNTLGALRELHKLGFDVMTYGKMKSQQREKLLALKNSSVSSNFGRLRPYQHQDMCFLAQLPHCGVFSEQRTGEQI